MPKHEDQPAGRAALGMIESLLLILEERRVLDAEGVQEVFTTAIESFNTAAREEEDVDGDNAAVARLLAQIQFGGNSVKRR